ncbi:hypothetical protein Pyrfu_1238 [Pyrolobus fumarii 1A]|uniref:Uncharacterized protein n=1 Tax=Pyrolobus fumarii (strain DSM 11204 / 1A) TaxID=694429 RepID=G0EFZ6_PYRF1|nr:hypothetical protein Pyrfu_1238 [Pyrolobus fumarii 1A]
MWVLSGFSRRVCRVGRCGLVWVLGVRREGFAGWVVWLLAAG